MTVDYAPLSSGIAIRQMRALDA